MACVLDREHRGHPRKHARAQRRRPAAADRTTRRCARRAAASRRRSAIDAGRSDPAAIGCGRHRLTGRWTAVGVEFALAGRLARRSPCNAPAVARPDRRRQAVRRPPTALARTAARRCGFAAARQRRPSRRQPPGPPARPPACGNGSPIVLGSTARTPTERPLTSSSGSMASTVALNMRPGNASSCSCTLWPRRSLPWKRSGNRKSAYMLLMSSRFTRSAPSLTKSPEVDDCADPPCRRTAPEWPCATSARMPARVAPAATCRLALLSSSTRWATKLWATSSWLRLRLACGNRHLGLRLLDLRPLQRVVQLHQHLPLAYPRAVGETEFLDPARHLGTQHHALARAQASLPTGHRPADARARPWRPRHQPHAAPMRQPRALRGRRRPCLAQPP